MSAATEIVWSVCTVRNRITERGGSLEMHATGLPRWHVCLRTDFLTAVEGNGKTFEEAYMAAHDEALKAVADFYEAGGILPSRKED